MSTSCIAAKAMPTAWVNRPPTSYLEKGETQTYRSRWQPAGEDAYDVVTEFQVKERWVPGFKLHMEKVTPAKLKEPKR
jgi:hypothetical protein